MTAPATPPIRPSAISTNRTSASVAPSEESMPRARCLRCAMTVNAAVATSPMKTRPSTETMRTMVAGERTESSGMGVLTVAPFGMTSPAAEAAAESFKDSPRKIRTWFGLASWPGATRANSSSRLDGSSTMPVTVKARPVALAQAGTCQVEPTRRL